MWTRRRWTTSRLSGNNEVCLPCRHVNQKALDQFTAFQDQRTDLARRQRENAQGEDKIRELIANLDQRKNDAIQTTFKARASFLGL